MIRISVEVDSLDSTQAVKTYKSLPHVKSAFHSINISQINVRPVLVYSAKRLRGYVFLCMLAYYVEWHLRRQLAPMQFQDDNPDNAGGKRTTPVQKAQVSDCARDKADTLKTAEGFAVHSLQTLLEDLATVTLNSMSLPEHPDQRFTDIADSTHL